MYILEVYVTNASLNINHSFTYLSKEKVDAFCRVEIKFNNRLTNGFVASVYELDKSKEELDHEFGYNILFIERIIDNEPILNQELYDLAHYMSKVTISPFISCLNVMLPKAYKTNDKISESTKIEHIIKNDISDIELTNRQKEIYDMLRDDMEAKVARKLSSSLIKKLIDNKAISIVLKDKTYDEVISDKSSFKNLTADQKAVYDKFINSDKEVGLLYGVTGSGKTEVYLHLARYYLSLNKKVLILVPEISLTPQMIKRVKERFDKVLIYHSYLSDNERYDTYKKVLKGEVNVVVGTRSSIFLPFDDLGLIIIDEEHDHSYKQDNVPCYNAKMIAFKRAKDKGAKILLASATPSLDTYTKAKRNDFELYELKNRINLNMPEVEIVNLNDAIRSGENPMISQKLEDEIRKNLENCKQTIILLNRRGYAPIVKCSECNATLMCSDCDIALSYHKDINKLKCHICGKTYNMPYVCPSCHKGKLVQYGFGTKKVVEYLSLKFKDARIERFDRDSTAKKDAHEKILKRFENKEIDILVGTQMLSKGLDFPDVTLVGILNADAGLTRDDYNSSEVTFDLLMQASGRSGRSEDKGKVIIEAFNDNHYVINAVKHQSYEMFYNKEMNYRFKASYPPYIHFAAIYLSDVNNLRLDKNIIKLYSLIKDSNLKTYEPISINKLKMKYRYRILIKDKSLVTIINTLDGIIKQYLKENSGSSLKIDIDPLYLE